MQFFDEMYEINKICRCCLKNIGEMKPLYGFSLDVMLCSVANLKVERSDGLPELLCFQCVLQLSRAFRFREQCLKSDTTIREYIKAIAIEPTRIAAISSECKVEAEDLDQQIKKNKPADEESISNNAEYQTLYEDDSYGSPVLHDYKELVTIPEEKPETVQTAECTKPNNDNCKKAEFKCQTCSKQFLRRKQLVRHSKIHDSAKPYKCSECDKSFTEKCNLNKHLLKHTGELRNISNKRHLCTICGNSFKYSSSLAKHTKFHTGKNLLQCPNCPKYYAERSALEIHLRYHTGDRPHACHQCDRRFSQASNLRKHLRSHSDERPFKCTICERTFVSHDYLATHLRTHNSEMRALCNACGKSFANSKTLNAHMRIHAKDRPHLCGYEDCNKSFTRLDTALAHRRIHSGEKPYFCNVCSRSFTTPTQLTIHLRTHTGEKLFTCALCPKKFATKNSLKLHSVKHATTQPTENEHQLYTDLNNRQLENEQITLYHDPEEEAGGQMFEQSVLFFKINENGELVPEAECTSIENVSTIQE